MDEARRPHKPKRPEKSQCRSDKTDEHKGAKAQRISWSWSDRLLVMSDGRLVHETTPATADLALVGQFMAGFDQHGQQPA